MRRRRLSHLALAIVLTSIAAGCFREPPSRVGMKRVGANLVFGVPELQGLAAPPGTVPETVENVEAEELEFRTSFRPTGEAPAVRSCPEAGDADFPAEPAPISITRRPKEGLYVWKMDGTQKPTDFPFRLKLPEFMDRSIEGLEPDPLDDTNFSFRSRENDPSYASNAIVTRTFRVDQNNPSPSLRGVLLTRIERDNQEDPPTIFEPNPPIQYLPLPVQVNASFETTGVDLTDPVRPQSLTHRGRVKERARVDACGTVIDSWLVVAEETFTAGPDSTRRKYFYSIATQFGGMLVFEHVESPCASPSVEAPCTNDPELIYDTNIGQTEPDPPPEQT